MTLGNMRELGVQRWPGTTQGATALTDKNGR
jgi:hypothetical protein